jgi:hypothetical protein
LGIWYGLYELYGRQQFGLLAADFGVPLIAPPG